ncbi:immunoglobulin-like domain-containing protein [Flavobacterium branchiicola]|uniref:Immunoglobulin-like domain-containing protein n=1 Tax=Flavobacterium branchiicola TaxID=1114875 RepID=A0ABV9PF73_9FLAO|nr:immunoglobulin-like domain-containing protein [Flavobacterium branchiicola]MBS7255391.1 DUF5011 domain-containing protein [Flavobacterium branchiicola]
MKKIFISLMVVSGLLFTSCEGDSTDGVSAVTAYANLSMNGPELVVLTQGETYTEQGVEAEADGKTLEVKIDGTVDTSKPSMYKIKYSAVNSDGFPAYLTRTVVVLSNKPSTIDLTGTFLRSGNPNVVSKVAGGGDRKYICDNATGYSVANDMLTLEFYNIDDKQIYAPYQENASASGISAESNIGTITDKDHWKWVIYASAVFGTADRVFAR